MDSEDSRDAGDARSSSSSSSSSSRSRRSSSSGSERSKKGPKSPPLSPRSPRSRGPRSPSPDSRSQSSAPISKPPRTPDHLSDAHSDINSPESSIPATSNDLKSPDGPISRGEGNIASPEHSERFSSGRPFAREGPKTPQSPKSSPGSPESRSRPGSHKGSRPGSPESKSRPASPDSEPPSKSGHQSRSVSRSRSRNSSTSPGRSPSDNKRGDWSPRDKWRRHTKGAQKIIDPPLRGQKRSRSESSQSSHDSYNKRDNKDTSAQDISEGEMESDQEDRKPRCRTKATSKQVTKDLNISHEDLSDVSDLDSMGQEDTEKELKPQSPPTSDNKQNAKVNGISQDQSPKSENGKNEITPKQGKLPQEKTSNTEDGEEQLDFEAEEGECVEPKPAEPSNGDKDDKCEGQLPEDVKPGRRSRGSSLEEGEVSDEAERRPEESEPRPVCRFFSRGACTWGVNCRFLHPGVTDKGNYNMFDVVRGIPSSGSYPTAPARDVPPPESAWERGLRTAKEMVRIANKRKEQDMDFEEKKLHLPLGGVVHDPDAELAYAAAAVGASPPRPLDAPSHHRETEVYSRAGYGPMYRGRGYPVSRPAVEDREGYYGRERAMYERERAGYERQPFYDERAPVPDEMGYQKQRRVRSSREVIVQRAEVERRDIREARDPRENRDTREVRDMRPRDVRDGRGDEWADPWMRAEPAAKRRKPQSSEESYSSSSSRSSRSPNARRKRRASSSSRQRLSPSVIVRERRLATARATAMNPPAPRRRAASPSDARQLAVNPPPPASHRQKLQEESDPYGRNKIPRENRERKKYSRSSSSGSESSTTSSESETDTHSSSTSGSSGARRARHARLLNAAARPRMNVKPVAGLAAAVTITNKKDSSSDKESGGRKRSVTSPEDDGAAGKAVSRREELLKQLKAVEDAIARKRSKI